MVCLCRTVSVHGKLMMVLTVNVNYLLESVKILPWVWLIIKVAAVTVRRCRELCLHKQNLHCWVHRQELHLHKQAHFHCWAPLLGHLVFGALLMDRMKHFCRDQHVFHIHHRWCRTSSSNLQRNSGKSGNRCYQQGSRGHIQLHISRCGHLLHGRQLRFATFITAMVLRLPGLQIPLLRREAVVVEVPSMSVQERPAQLWDLDPQRRLARWGSSCWTFFPIMPSKWTIFWSRTSIFIALMNCA